MEAVTETDVGDTDTTLIVENAYMLDSVQFDQSSSDGDPRPNKCTIRIPMPGGASQAEIVRRSLAPDAELRPAVANRVLRTDGEFLVAEFEAAEARLLRTTVRGFFDFLDVILQTIDELSPA